MSLILSPEGGFEYCPPSECHFIQALAAAATIAASAKSIFGGGGGGGQILAEVNDKINNVAANQKELSDAFVDTTTQFTSRIGRIERGIVSPVASTNEFDPIDNGAKTAKFLWGLALGLWLLAAAK